MVKNPPCQCRRPGFYPWAVKISCRGEWLPAPVFLPGEPHGQRSLEGYSLWGRKESATTERLILSLPVLLAESLSGFDGARHSVGDTQLHASCFLVVVVAGLVAKSCLTLATSWTIARQAPLSVKFSRQEYWSGLPFPAPGDLPDQGIEPRFPALQADSLKTELRGKPIVAFS